MPHLLRLRPPHVRSIAVALGLLLAGTGACSDDDGTRSDPPPAADPGTQGSNGDSVTSAGSSDTSVPVASDSAGGTTPTADEGAALDQPPQTYPRTCSVDGDCETGAQSCVEQICLTTPTEESFVTSPETEIRTQQRPDLRCVGDPLEPPAEPLLVQMWGVVDRFGGGKKTIGVEVAVFRQRDFKPQGCTEEDAEERRTCILEHATPIGTAVSIDPDDWAPNADKVADLANIDCAESTDCPLGYECDDPKGFNECVKQYGVYEIEGVEADVPLVVRARPTTDRLHMREGYVHQAVLLSSRAYDEWFDRPTLRFDPTVISESQWVQVPNTFGSSIRIAEGHTALGGRIRDCTVEGRYPEVSYYVAGANVGSANVATKIGYFNDREDDALPQPAQTSTNALGRYAVIDVPAGWNRVAAAALIDSKVTSLGAHDLWLVPDALNILSFPGRISYVRH